MCLLDEARGVERGVGVSAAPHRLPLVGHAAAALRRHVRDSGAADGQHRDGGRLRGLQADSKGAQRPGFSGSVKPTRTGPLPGHGGPESALSGPLGRRWPQLYIGYRPLSEAAARGQAPPSRPGRSTALNGPETIGRFASRRLHHEALPKHPDVDRSRSDVPTCRADSRLQGLTQKRSRHTFLTNHHQTGILRRDVWVQRIPHLAGGAECRKLPTTGTPGLVQLRKVEHNPAAKTDTAKPQVSTYPGCSPPCSPGSRGSGGNGSEKMLRP